MYWFVFVGGDFCVVGFWLAVWFCWCVVGVVGFGYCFGDCYVCVV